MPAKQWELKAHNLIAFSDYTEYDDVLKTREVGNFWTKGIILLNIGILLLDSESCVVFMKLNI